MRMIQFTGGHLRGCILHPDTLKTGERGHTFVMVRNSFLLLLVRGFLNARFFGLLRFKYLLHNFLLLQKKGSNNSEPIRQYTR